MEEKHGGPLAKEERWRKEREVLTKWKGKQQIHALEDGDEISKGDTLKELLWEETSAVNGTSYSTMASH